MEKILVTIEEFEKTSKKYHSGMDVKIGDYKIYCYVNDVRYNNVRYLTLINEQEIGEKYEFIGYDESNNVPIFNEKSKSFFYSINLNFYTDLIEFANEMKHALDLQQQGYIKLLEKENIPYKFDDKFNAPVIEISLLKNKKHILHYRHPELTKILSKHNVIFNQDFTKNE